MNTGNSKIAMTFFSPSESLQSHRHGIHLDCQPNVVISDLVNQSCGSREVKEDGSQKVNNSLNKRCYGDSNGNIDVQNMKGAQLSGLDKLALRQRKVYDPEVSNPVANLVTDSSDRNRDRRGSVGFHGKKMSWVLETLISDTSLH